MSTEALSAPADEQDGSTAQSEEMDGQGGDPLDSIADEKQKAELKIALKNLVQEYATMEKFTRRQEVMETRRQRYFWRNDQYIWWNYAAWMFVPLSGGSGVGGGTGGSSDNATDPGNNFDVYNIYTPYGESLIATLSQNPPGVNFEPDDPMQPADISKSKAAEKYKQQLDRDNPMKQLRTEVARLTYTDNRIVLYTRPISDEQELGVDEQGKPNARQKLEAFGTLESKVIPSTATERSELVAAFLSREMDINIAKETYKDAASEIQEGSSSAGESSYERFARLGVLQGKRQLSQAADAMKHLVTRHRVWLRPAAFQRAAEAHRETLKKLYPIGCKVIICGDAYCTSRNESMDDHLSIGFATPGDGMSRPSMGKRMVPLQMAFNDAMNQWTEANGECIPVTFYDQRILDSDSFREQVSQPGNNVGVELPPGVASIESCFHEQVSPGTAVGLESFIALVNGPLAQFMSGALPALMGQGEANNKTKGGIEILRDQAMGRVGIPWGLNQELWAESYRQSVEGAAAIADDNASFAYERKTRSGKTIATEKVKYSDLKKGNIRCYPDIDSSFPETTNAKRNTFMGLESAAEGNPALQADLQLPENQAFGYRLIGLPELVSTGEEAREKQLEEIQELLKDGPIPPPPEAFVALAIHNKQAAPIVKRFLAQWDAAKQATPPQRMPVPPKALWPLFAPSVDVDAENDFNEYESAECKTWLSSPERREQDKAGNQLGVMNVILHKQRHDKAIAANAPQPQQKPISQSINFKDAPPEMQVQMAADAGYKLTPQMPPNPQALAAAVTGNQPQATQ
jgi:hypothetical protein